MSTALDIFLHLDVYLNQLASDFGPWIYILLFLVVFAETGLVIFPFLPGDSLLFSAGALCAMASLHLNVHLLAILLMAAGIMGDSLNYFIGYKVGLKVLHGKSKWLINKNHIEKTANFYQRYGAKTVVLARFVPIVRTFAPFVAGVGRMNPAQFLTFNVMGAVSWVLITLYSGYWFGNIPWVKDNFHLVVVGIIVISLLPLILELIRFKLIRRVDMSPEG